MASFTTKWIRNSPAAMSDGNRKEARRLGVQFLSSGANSSVMAPLLGSAQRNAAHILWRHLIVSDMLRVVPSAFDRIPKPDTSNVK